jgi:hypothetical protein
MDQRATTTDDAAAQAASDPAEAAVSAAEEAAPAPPPKTWDVRLRDQIRATLSDDSKTIAWQMYIALRLVTKYRAELLRPVLIKHVGLKVQMGPFAGMEFLPNVLEGCYIPKLLGSYEMELHPHWMRMRQRRKYRTIIDVGAAEGYYAVGLALMFPDARVLARDINPQSPAAIADLARRNGVAGRVEIGGVFSHEDFQAEARGETLVLCDIEGGEDELLDPARAPALLGCDIVVELHKDRDGDQRRLLQQRFGATHDITLVEETGRDVPLPPMFDRLDSIDRLLATWEYRMSATPWAVLRARQIAA